ncbi:fungal-specific transcription factor domain-containing protein [Microdochium trichocladiopsis]|uniref:Fungal-specific transcription factor domain-containing protein n=1 Tax=Microdochium trichocladiopsis TaxID=1682393 RepID=A0A9P8Y0H5_9PEZI|nr:fungal-specific transcription factor domain-containing protein [Microdochium trichocladiopsis]KAH7024577.1 fungal-specific transcription factor domain-containing protein [Microdochium trichocladiopsis]
MLQGVGKEDKDLDIATQLDKILAELEYEAPGRNQDLLSWQRVQGPFGVFSAFQSKASSPALQPERQDGDGHALGTWGDNEDFGTELDQIGLFADAVDLGMPNLIFQQPPLRNWDHQKASSPEPATLDGNGNPLFQAYDLSSSAPTYGSLAWQIQASEPELPAAISPQALPMHESPYLPRCAQYLLWHYSNHTIPSLSGIPLQNENSLWKRLHLPTALQAYAELGVLGDSSLPRVSLLYSLMSIACFQLKALHKDAPGHGVVAPFSLGPAFAAESWSAADWEAQGIKFRDIAQTGLQKFLRNAETSRSVGASYKYKEVLVAAVSLVCIRIVSGDTTDARPYILQCEHIIRNMNPSKNRLSRKTSNLHEIFYYIQVMESASSVQHSSHHTRRLLPYAADQDTGDTDLEVGAGVTLTRDTDIARVSSSELCLDETDGEEDVMYGIPGSLIHLLARTTALIEKTEQSDPSQGDKPSTSSPIEVEKMTRTLENDICAWPGQRKHRSIATRPPARDVLATQSGVDTDTIFEPTSDSFHKDSVVDCSLPRLMTDCLAQALHAAILIHFFRTVRKTHPAILQHYVEAVTSHLEMHASLKTMSAPARLNAIVWPSFIAACEAIDEGLRRRGIACLRQAAWAGFCNWEAAEAVTREVWRRRDAGDTCASWQQVVRDLSVHMVLT